MCCCNIYTKIATVLGMAHLVTGSINSAVKAYVANKLRAVGAGPAGAAATGPKFGAPTKKKAAADSLSTNLARIPLLP